MAYISTENVKAIRDQIKKAYPHYKWSVSRRHSSTVVVVLRESDLPIETYQDINQYYLKETAKLTTKAKLVFQHVIEICNGVELCYNRNAGDIYADYGDSTYFMDLSIGEYSRPHKIIPAVSPAHPYTEVGAEMTPESAHQYQQECTANRLTHRIGEFSGTPAGYLPHLNVTITEEAI